MNDSGVSRRRQQLLDKFLAGEIDQATYDRLLVELQQLSSLGTGSESPRDQSGSTSVEADQIAVSSTHHPLAAAHAPRVTPLVEPGVELGGFRIEQRLGRGGMGEVWKARDVIGERTVVLKLLHPELSHHTNEMAAVKQMFHRVHSLQHQNICPLYLLGHDERYGYYVVMRYLDGDTLAAYRIAYAARHGFFPLSEVVRVLTPIASALDYAHAAHVLHRDVKPQNIMLGDDGQLLQLVDFGLAAEIRTSLSRLSSTSVEFGGTYPYMAPEQWRGEPLDARADQYALAVVAYELLAGRRPFDSSDPAVLRLCAMNDVPPVISEVDAAANAVLLRGMAKEKTDRFESCAALIAALGQCLNAKALRSSSNSKSVISASTSKGMRIVGQPKLLDTKPADDEIVHSLDELIERDGRQTRKTSSRKVVREVEDWDDEGDEDSTSAQLLREANRRAAFWVGLVAGFSLVSVAALLMFAIWGAKFLWSTPDSSANSQAISMQGGGTNGSHGSSDGSAVPNQVGKPAPFDPVVAALRYRWQSGSSYVYAVNIDIDQDADLVMSLSGNLTYTAMNPPAQAPPNTEGEGKGTGTAFVVHSDGYLLTCQHVVEGAAKLEVSVGGKTYEATVIDADDVRDIALIRINATGLSTLPLGSSDAVELGEEVRAIGFPLSSILGDNIKATRGTVSGINTDEGLKVFQIDAGINPGNSGGPLVNERGHVIGVNFAKLYEDVAANVGFAVPIDDAKSMLTSKGVKFVAGNGGAKLEGPALVKQVAAATALVTVTLGGGPTGLGSRITLKCEGTLSPRVRSRAGHLVDPHAHLAMARTMMYSSIRGVGSEANQVDTDALGRVHDVRGSHVLPSFLGKAARLIVEQLPAGRQKTWSYSHPVVLSIQEEGDANTGLRSPFGPRFGPRFRPPGFPGSPFDEPTKTTQFQGSLKVVYTMGDLVGTLQTIKKSFELKTRDNAGVGPRILMKGDGAYTLNMESGLPYELDFNAMLTENEAARSTRTPLKVSYKLLESLNPQEAARRAGQPAAGSGFNNKPGSANPGPVVADEARLEVGQKLLAEWAGKWYPVKVLAVKPDGTVRIHWEGWADSFDEDVPRSKLRTPLE